MRRMLIALLSIVALVASMIGLSVGMAAPASADEGIVVTPSSIDPGDTPALVQVDLSGLATGTWVGGFPYKIRFNGFTGPATTFCMDIASATNPGELGMSMPLPTKGGSATSNCSMTGDTVQFHYQPAPSAEAIASRTITLYGLLTAPSAGAYFVDLLNGSNQVITSTRVGVGPCPAGDVVPAAPAAPAVITIDFDGNGGTCTTTKVTGFEGTWANAPTDSVCTRDGYLLGSFNTSADGSGLSIPVGGNLNLTGDNRLFAQWLSADAPVLTPGAPTDVVATSLWNRVQVNWTAPVNQGTTPVINYLVNAHPGASVCITSVAKDRKPTQCSFNGQLTAGTKYTFTVSALNYGGWGDTSIASAPASPQSLRITKHKRSKVFLSRDSKVDVGGIAPGYAARTKVTPWVKVGDTGTWVAQKGSLATVNASGKFGWGARFQRNAASQSIYVKFTVDGTNFSNIVQIRPSGASTSVKQIYIVRKDREIAPSGRQYVVATAQTHGFKKGEQLAVWLKWGSGTFAKSPGSLKVAADGTVGLRIPVATRNRSESVTLYIASQDDQVKSNVATESAP